MSVTGAHSRQRLAAISHHFLSEVPSSAVDVHPPVKRPVVVPVFSIRVERPLPLALLTRALLARGRSASVLDVSRERPNVTPPNPSSPSHPDPPTLPADTVGGGGGPAFGDPLMGQVAALEPAPDICLVPMAHDQWPAAREFGRLLLVVGCCREGVVSAYQQIKRFWAVGRVGPIGVIMADATDAKQAALHFDTLSRACEHFLRTAPVSYGFLPRPLTGYAPVDLLDPDGADGGMGAALGGIATLLCADMRADRPDRDIDADMDPRLNGVARVMSKRHIPGDGP